MEISRPPIGPLYLITERCGPERGQFWDGYIAWSGLTQLTEVVTLDGLLCPYIVSGEFEDEDWHHIVNEHGMLDYFFDLEYLVRRAGHLEGRNLLCLFRNPESQPSLPVGQYQFIFEGYDLVDVDWRVSALTNCGGYPMAFSNSELSTHGLIESLARAKEIRQRLEECYGGANDHGRCDVWAIFRAAT
jgi:hypothetical protein